jgi:two-component system NarL family sensor kinase
MKRTQLLDDARRMNRRYICFMNLKNRMILHAIAPLILSLCAIAFTVYYQATVLGELQQATIEQSYKESKDMELKNYIALAEQAIAHLYDSGRTDAAAIKEAKAILADLSYRPDGYFFLFNLEGEMLMHPRQPELVGQNLWNLRDENGDPAIQKLITRALKGGGFEDYMWRKPSRLDSGSERKRAYVVVLNNWNWVLGTGVYLDDVDTALAKIDSQVSSNILSTMLWILAIAFLSVAAIVWGLILNIRKRDEADAKLIGAEKKLRRVAQQVIRAQEEERSRMRQDLHDGVKPMVAVLKMLIEVAAERLLAKSTGSCTGSSPPQVILDEATVLAGDTLGAFERVIQDIEPTDLEAGLEDGLKRLARRTNRDTTPVTFTVGGQARELSGTVARDFYAVASAALDNIFEHAQAKSVTMHLEWDLRFLRLTIRDDGKGFDVERVRADPDHGLGLRNMELRMESVGGTLSITSSSDGTMILATVFFNQPDK